MHTAKGTTIKHFMDLHTHTHTRDEEVTSFDGTTSKQASEDEQKVFMNNKRRRFALRLIALFM